MQHDALLFLQDLQEQGTLNGIRFQLVLVERQVDRLAGHGSADESAKHKAIIEKLEEALASAKADTEVLSGQLQTSLEAAGKPGSDLHPAFLQNPPTYDGLIAENTYKLLSS